MRHNYLFPRRHTASADGGESVWFESYHFDEWWLRQDAIGALQRAGLWNGPDSVLRIDGALA